MNKSIQSVAIVACMYTLSSASGTDLTLVQNGQPQATIVVSKTPTKSAAYAAADLRENIRLITRTNLPIVTDDQSVEGTRILVGESDATRALGYANTNFGSQSYRIDFAPNGAPYTLMLIGSDNDKADFGTGTVYGPTNWIGGAHSNALSFDGASTLNVDNSGFTDNVGSMECWVRFDDVTSGYEEWILRMDGYSPPGWSYQFVCRCVDNRVRYRIYWDWSPAGYVDAISVNPLSTNEWHYLLMTYDATANGGLGKAELIVDDQPPVVATGSLTGYRPTSCANTRLRVGGVSDGGAVGAGLYGDIDEVRFSSCVRNGAIAYQDALAHAPYPDDDTTLLLHLDSTSGAPIREYIPNLVTLDNAPSPDILTSRGTCYAVYDFLERYCGVRWYNPTASGTWGPDSSTLTVSGSVVARASPYEMRVRVPESMPMNASYNASVGTLWPYGSPEYTNYIAAAYPGETEAEITSDVQRLLHRWRAGGKDNGCNHSFYGYYDRFHTTHPTWFADYYRNSDHSIGAGSQLCYSNPEVIAQVAQDAAAYYAANGYDGRTFSVVPMDNDLFCTCSACTNGPCAWIKDTSGYFSNGSASDHIFNFVNQVVTALHAIPGHTNDKVSELAYMCWAAVPTTVTIDPSVNVFFCFAGNRLIYGQAYYNHEVGYLAAWTNEAAISGRDIGLWLYPFTPETAGASAGFKYFPGYYAHSLATQFGLFSTNFGLGIYLCGAGQEVENYVTLKLLDDPTQEVDALLGNYFSDLYGPAAAPMSNFYTLVEATYTNTANYPAGMATNTLNLHQTEAYAWGWLGTSNRMAQLQTFMTEAINAAGSGNIYATNVHLFEIGTWEYMLAGRAEYLAVHRPPTVTITSPNADAVLTGTITITASATDDIGVASVAFYADGVLLGTDTDGSDGWNWTWTAAAPGAHRLLAVATDYAPMKPGVWHHVLATHDQSAGKIELFVDGVSQGTAVFTSTTCSNSDLWIGGIQMSNALIGDIDEARVSSVVLDGEAAYLDALANPPVQDGSTTLLRHFDASNDLNGATVYGDPVFMTGRYGNALRFDGADSVRVPNSGFTDVAGTMEAWVRFGESESGNMYGTIFRLDGSNPWTYHILDRHANRVCYTVYDGAVVGRSVWSLESNSIPSDAVVVTVYNVTNNLTARWNFENNAYDTAPVGTADNGTLKSGMTYNNSDNKVGAYALNFVDANKQYMSVANQADLNPTGSFTICAWVKATNWSGNRRIIQKGGNGTQYRLYHNLNESGIPANTLVCEVKIGSPAVVKRVTIARPSANAWHHVAATYNGASLKLYVDGGTPASSNVTGAVSTTTSPLYIGAKSSFDMINGDYWKGVMDDVRIYNGRALTQNEIIAVMGISQ